jgi:type I restriction enzyme S subunit
MTDTLRSRATLTPNPAWASLALFDRKAWKRIAFGDFAESIGERTEPSDVQEEIYVGLEHLDPRSLHIRQWGKGSDVTGTKLRFRKGDIIFGRRRAYQRKLAIAEFDGICSAHAMVVRARPHEVLPEFLPFLMMSDRFMNRAVEISVGSLSPTINWTALKQQTFELPPIDQQRRISEILWTVDETAASFEDALRASNDALTTSLGQMFSNGRGHQRFEVAPLSSVVRLQTGIAKGKTYAPAVRTIELPYLRVANVQDGHLNLCDMKTIVIPEAEKDRYLLRNGDVVICEGGDFDKVGRGAVWRGQVANCLHQNHVFSLRVDSATVLPEFLALQLASPYGKRYFLSCAKKTSNLASINSTQVKAFPFQVAPLKEQQAFTTAMAKLQSTRDSLEAHTKSTRNSLAALTDALT